MKRLYSAIFLLVAILMLAPSTDAAAQSEYVPTPVEISRNKVRIGDEVFYEHIVKERQTLYSICKVYGVSESTLREYNPGKLDNGLKTGSVLMIPVQPEKPSVKKVAKPADDEVVASGASTVTQTPDTTGSGVRYINHRVKWYDSLAMIALKYKISQEDIMRINNLDSRTLVVNQVLRIPVDNYTESLSEDIDQSVIFDVADQAFDEDTLISIFNGDGDIVADNVSETEDEEETEEVLKVQRDHFVPFSGSANIALMLPIAARSSAPSVNFLDFYAGVMMGLNEIKAEGISVKMHVIDMADYDNFDAMLADNPLENYDFVIGNFNVDNIGGAADYCDQYHVPLISPLDQKIEQQTYDHPYLINVPVSGGTQIRNTIQSMDYSAGQDNVVVIYETGGESGSYFTSLCSMLDSLDVPFKKLNYSISGGRGAQESIQNLLDPSKENHIFIASEKEAFASDAMRNVSLIGRGSRYRITGHTSHKVRNFDS
ncbi:MAG: LysM peptidoglycan-binding domain-containing protein, partial [Bacteroidales bacterium]|nr:LysM peptidoglycan-binding domain-containing protein [Candidatus Equibacterium intestinale]